MGKAALRYAKRVESLSEYSGTCMDIRACNLLISADEHAQTSVSEHGDRHSPRPAGTYTAQKQHAGSLEVDAQPSAARIRLPEGAARKIPPSARRAYIPGTSAASGPEPIGPRTWKDPDPRRRSSRESEAQDRPACPAATATRRLRPVPSQRFLALWCQAHTPSCSRQVTSTSIRMVRPARLALLAVTHR